MKPLSDDQRNEIALNICHSIRIAHDLSCLRLRDLVHSTDNWIVAEIAPAERSGRLQLFGAHLNADTGEMVADQEHPELRIVAEGKWRLKQNLMKARSRKGKFQSYEWTQVQEQWQRGISSNELFPVFYEHGGGHIICVHNSKASGAEQFGSAALIPDEWADQVKPALTFLSKNRKKLKDLARADLDNETSVGGNPFVRIAFFQELIDDQVRTELLAKAFLPRFRGHAQATIAYSLARQSLTEMSGPLADCVQHAASPAEITGMMTGLQAHALLGVPQLDSDNTLRAVCDRVKQRYESIRDDSNESSELNAVLELLKHWGAPKKDDVI